MLMLLVASVPMALPVMFTMSAAMGARMLADKGILATRLRITSAIRPFRRPAGPYVTVSPGGYRFDRRLVSGAVRLASSVGNQSDT